MKNYQKGGSQTLFYEPSAVRKRAVKGGQVSSSLTLILVMFPMTRVMFTMTSVMFPMTRVLFPMTRVMFMMVMLMIAVPMLTMTMVRLMEIMVRIMEMMVISRRASSSFSSPPLPWPGKRQRWRWISTPPSQGHKAPRPCLRNNLFTYQLKRKVMMIKMLVIMMKMKMSILHLFSCQTKLLAKHSTSVQSGNCKLGKLFRARLLPVVRIIQILRYGLLGQFTETQRLLLRLSTWRLYSDTKWAGCDFFNITPAFTKRCFNC